MSNELKQGGPKGISPNVVEEFHTVTKLKIAEPNIKLLSSTWHGSWTIDTRLYCHLLIQWSYMFNSLYTIPPTDVDIATQTLSEEGSYRFSSFSASDAVTLVSFNIFMSSLTLLTNDQGLSIRKRFRASSRHNKGKGLVISIQTIAGHTLFACTVGDLSSISGIGDVSLDSWACLEGMINVVRRTGHSSFYVEKGMNAMGKTPKQMGIQGDSFRVQGGGKFVSH